MAGTCVQEIGARAVHRNGVREAVHHVAINLGVGYAARACERGGHQCGGIRDLDAAQQIGLRV